MTSSGISATDIATVIAALSAAIAAIFAGIQILISRKDSRIGRRPYLAQDTNLSLGSDTKIRISISNDGVGPAKIISWDYTHNGKPIDDLQKYINNALPIVPKSVSIHSIKSGALIPALKNVVVLSLHFDKLDDNTLKNIITILDDVDLEIVYESLYKERFYLNSAQ